MCSSVYVTFGDFTVKLSISMVLGRPISRRGLLCFERRPREEGGGSATRGAIGRDTRVTARRRSGRCRSSSVGRVIAAMAGAYLSRVSRCGLGNTVVSVSWFGGRPDEGERGPTISASNRGRRCFLGQMRATGGVDGFDREKRFVERHASIDGGDFRKRVFSSSITTSRRERRDETVRFRLRSDDDDERRTTPTRALCWKHKHVYDSQLKTARTGRGRGSSPRRAPPPPSAPPRRTW